MQPQQHPADAFSGDPVSYRSIAAQVESMKVSALTPSQFDDVITLIEYMRAEALKVHNANMTTAEELSEREHAVSQRERDVAIRHRAVEAALKVQGPRRWLRWR